MTSQTSILTIVIIVILVIVVLAAFRGISTQIHDDLHHDRGHGNHGGCRCDSCTGGKGCDPPFDVHCEPHGQFGIMVTWEHPECDAHEYNVYIKYLEECHEDSPCESKSRSRGSRSRGSRSRSRRSRSRSPSQYKHGQQACGCDPCKNRRKKRCGKRDHDKLVVVPGDQNSVKIYPLKVPAVCVSVSSVTKCGKESTTCTPCTCCIDCSAEVDPCLDTSTCEGVTIKWEPVDCATAYKIYYDDDLLYELPGDASGATGLPPIEHNEPYGCETQECEPPTIYVQVCTPCGEGPRVPVERDCYVPSPSPCPTPSPSPCPTPSPSCSPGSRSPKGSHGRKKGRRRRR